MKKWIVVFIFLAGLNVSVFSRTKTILYINSYHAGYPSSDEVKLAIAEGVKLAGDSLITIYMDCKRNTSAEHGRLKADSIIEQINFIKPDGIMISDDDAVKYLVVPYLKKSSYPVVFCGVNWDCSQYGLPVANVTGVLEVLPLRELLGVSKSMNPEMKKLAVLSENTVSELNNKQLLDTLYRSCGFAPDYFLVDNFEEWKTAFVETNSHYDLIYMPTNGAVKNWDREQAKAFVMKHTKKPTITCDDFMMDYCAFGLTKVAYEQGQRAITMMYTLLKTNCRPVELPIERNVQHTSWINKALAETTGLTTTPFEKLNPIILNQE